MPRVSTISKTTKFPFHASIIKKDVHEGTEYPEKIASNYIYSLYGSFYEYYMRYYLEASTDSMADQSIRRFTNMTHINGDGIDESTIFTIRDAYARYKLGNATISDIWNVSLCHSYIMNGPDAFDHINAINSIPNCKDVDEYLETLPKSININPSLKDGTGIISGEADFIYDDIIMDSKCSKNDIGSRLSDFVQLLIYATLYTNSTGKKINTLVIYNPLRGYTSTVDMSSWTQEKEFLEELSKKYSTELKFPTCKEPSEELMLLTKYSPELKQHTCKEQTQAFSQICFTELYRLVKRGWSIVYPLLQVGGKYPSNIIHLYDKKY